MKSSFSFTVIKQCLIITSFFSMLIFCFYSLSAASALFAGACWGCMNLFLMQLLLENLVLSPAKSYLLLGLKFPMLYLLGYFLLSIKFFPALFLLAGFSIVLVVIVFNGLAKAMAGDFSFYDNQNL